MHAAATLTTPPAAHRSPLPPPRPPHLCARLHPRVHAHVLHVGGERHVAHEAGAGHEVVRGVLPVDAHLGRAGEGGAGGVGARTSSVGGASLKKDPSRRALQALGGLGSKRPSLLLSHWTEAVWRLGSLPLLPVCPRNRDSCCIMMRSRLAYCGAWGSGQRVPAPAPAGVCVGCLVVRTPSRAPYRTPSACANRAAYPDPPPVVPDPESIDAQAAYR